MARVLVTGGAGFIGANFVRLLAEETEHELVVLDKLTYAGNRDNLGDFVEGGRVAFRQEDVCDASAVTEAIQGCDAVIHFAAETHVDRSITEAGAFVTTDVYGTFVVLEAARKSGVDRVLHISTDEVYGEAGDAPSPEDAPLRPKSPYAASKAGADRLAYAYHATYDLPVVITRCVNNYGRWQHPEKAIPLFTICALLDHPLPLYGTGENQREWIHVEDHCKALLTLLRASSGVEGETFNIGTGERRTTREVAEAVVDAVGKPRDLIAAVADRPGHVLRHAVASDKLQAETGWSPAHRFDEAVPTTAAWYAKHPIWWRNTILGPARPYFEARYPDLVQAVERRTYSTPTSQS